MFLLPKLDSVAGKLTSWIGSPISFVVHTLFFVGMLALALAGFDLDKLLLVLTTIVSLEAIYLSIFIQYSVNQHTKTLTEVAEDIEDVTEDVGELSAEVEDISENIEDLQTDAAADQETATYERLEQQLRVLLDEVRHLKEKNTPVQPTPPNGT